MAVDRYRQTLGVCWVVGRAFGTASGRRFKVKLLSGLVVDLCDGTACAGAEGVLRGGVGIAVLGGQNVLGRPLARALSGIRSSFADLVKGSRVAGDNQAHRAVRRDALLTGRVQYVARQGTRAAAGSRAASGAGTAAGRSRRATGAGRTAGGKPPAGAGHTAVPTAPGAWLSRRAAACTAAGAGRTAGAGSATRSRRA